MEFMKKFRIGSGLSNFHIYTPLVTDWSRGGTGSEVPESTQAGFCVFFSDPESKIWEKPARIRCHFSILAVAGVCVVIS